MSENTNYECNNTATPLLKKRSPTKPEKRHMDLKLSHSAEMGMDCSPEAAIKREPGTDRNCPHKATGSVSSWPSNANGRVSGEGVSRSIGSGGGSGSGGKQNRKRNRNESALNKGHISSSNKTSKKIRSGLISANYLITEDMAHTVVQAGSSRLNKQQKAHKRKGQKRPYNPIALGSATPVPQQGGVKRGTKGGTGPAITPSAASPTWSSSSSDTSADSPESPSSSPDAEDRLTLRRDHRARKRADNHTHKVSLSGGGGRSAAAVGKRGALNDRHRRQKLLEKEEEDDDVLSVSSWSSDGFPLDHGFRQPHASLDAYDERAPYYNLPFNTDGYDLSAVGKSSTSADAGGECGIGDNVSLEHLLHDKLQEVAPNAMHSAVEIAAAPPEVRATRPTTAVLAETAGGLAKTGETVQATGKETSGTVGSVPCENGRKPATEVDSVDGQAPAFKLTHIATATGAVSYCARTTSHTAHEHCVVAPLGVPASSGRAPASNIIISAISNSSSIAVGDSSVIVNVNTSSDGENNGSKDTVRPACCSDRGSEADAVATEKDAHPKFQQPQSVEDDHQDAEEKYKAPEVFLESQESLERLSGLVLASAFAPPVAVKSADRGSDTAANTVEYCFSSAATASVAATAAQDQSRSQRTLSTDTVPAPAPVTSTTEHHEQQQRQQRQHNQQQQSISSELTGTEWATLKRLGWKHMQDIIIALDARSKQPLQSSTLSSSSSSSSSQKVNRSASQQESSGRNELDLVAAFNDGAGAAPDSGAADNGAGVAGDSGGVKAFSSGMVSSYTIRSEFFLMPGVGIREKPPPIMAFSAAAAAASAASASASASASATATATATASAYCGAVTSTETERAQQSSTRQQAPVNSTLSQNFIEVCTATSPTIFRIVWWYFCDYLFIVYCLLFSLFL